MPHFIWWIGLCSTFLFTLAFSANDNSRDADVSLDVLYVFMDAPWRLQLRQPETDYIPVQFHFPEAKKGWERIKVQGLAVYQIVEDKYIRVFSDSAGEQPFCKGGCNGSSFSTADGYGKPTGNMDIVVKSGDMASPWQIDKIEPNNLGWHTIVRIPIKVLANPFGKSYLVCAEAMYAPIRKNVISDKNITIRKVLKIDIDNQSMPDFPGWHYYDIHTHTAAEFEDALGIIVLRKDFGGPTQMYREAAYSIGMIDSIDGFANRVISTDHNSYMSDDTVPGYGPTSFDKTKIVVDEKLKKYFIDSEGKHHPIAQKEYEKNVELYGITRGEEITLAKENPLTLAPLNLGSHMLAYSSRHFMGPFHGGKFPFGLEKPNTNRIAMVLNEMAIDSNYPLGFSYAAHPFMVPKNFLQLAHWLPAWEDEQIDIALTKDFVHQDESGNPIDFVFKGVQFWNGRDDQHTSASLFFRNKVMKYLENPFTDKKWNKGDSEWDESILSGFLRWQEIVRKALKYSFKGQESKKFIRKVYFGGGTDAHGCFNRTTSVLARSLTELPKVFQLVNGIHINNNAFAKVRTYVDGSSSTGDRELDQEKTWLNALSEGRTVMTDGPIATFSMDANPYFNSDTLTWHPYPVFENENGKIGGEGKMDGGRTMLVIHNDILPYFKYQWRNSETFGGDITRIEIFKTNLGNKPPTRDQRYGFGKSKIPRPVGFLRPDKGKDTFTIGTLLDEQGDELKAEVINGDLGAIVLAAFTEKRPLPPFNFRCYTNPVWVVPINMDTYVWVNEETAFVSLRFIFPVSMTPEKLEAMIVPLNDDGISVQDEAIALDPKRGGNNGWNANKGVDNSVYTVNGYVNIDKLRKGRLIYYLKNPRDNFGNTLNSVAARLNY